MSATRLSAGVAIVRLDETSPRFLLVPRVRDVLDWAEHVVSGDG